MGAAIATVQPVESSAPATPVPPAATQATGPQPTAISTASKSSAAPLSSPPTVYGSRLCSTRKSRPWADVFVWARRLERAHPSRRATPNLFAGCSGRGSDQRVLRVELWGRRDCRPFCAGPGHRRARNGGSGRRHGGHDRCDLIPVRPRVRGGQALDRTELMPVIDPTGVSSSTGPAPSSRHGDGTLRTRRRRLLLRCCPTSTSSRRVSAMAEASRRRRHLPRASENRTGCCPGRPTQLRVALTGDAVPAFDFAGLGGSRRRQHGARRPATASGRCAAPGTVTSWCVRWDATGQYVAIW